MHTSFLRVVVQTRAHGKILVIFDKNRVLLAKNRRATKIENGANLQHDKKRCAGRGSPSDFHTALTK
ncbi:MAG: hypothetical protein ACI90V_012370 [Bacillariaceae sp.]